MKYLVIPDVHQKLDKVKKIIENNQFDRLISLGDWFDNFYDKPEDSRQTALYILELYERLGDNFIWTLGNHDVPYLFPESAELFWCSGNTQAKLEAILGVFKDRLDYKRLKLAYKIKYRKKKDIILSHAGVHKYHFAKIGKKNISSRAILDMCQTALDTLAAREYDPMIGSSAMLILHAGASRGGSLPVGGITWQDWYRDFTPIKNISQIVGHTPSQNPQVIDGSRIAIAPDAGSLETGLEYHIAPDISYNFNIDTHLNHYMIIENGKIILHKNYD